MALVGYFCYNYTAWSFKTILWYQLLHSTYQELVITMLCLFAYMQDGRVVFCVFLDKDKHLYAKNVKKIFADPESAATTKEGLPN